MPKNPRNGDLMTKICPALIGQMEGPDLCGEDEWHHPCLMQLGLKCPSHAELVRLDQEDQNAAEECRKLVKA
jgi:hypothetical protein